MVEIKIRNWPAFLLKKRYFIGFDCCCIENVQEIWPAKMDFGQPYVEIGWKMADDQLLFLALFGLSWQHPFITH